MDTTDTTVERGSGNVFADLDLPDADVHFAKAELVSRIDDVVRERGITQAEAARLRWCITQRVQLSFDRMHDHLRRVGRRDASLDDVEWVYAREMQGVRGQVDLQHYEGRLETVSEHAGYRRPTPETIVALSRPSGSATLRRLTSLAAVPARH